MQHEVGQILDISVQHFDLGHEALHHASEFNPDLIILDENFSALDPENLQQSFQCVLNHARTLLVIAHP